MKKSFILHTDALCILDKMTNEQAGLFIKTLYRFQLTGETPELDFAMDMAVTPFINQFKRDDVKYSQFIDKQVVNGLKGGRPKKTQNNPKNPSLLEKPKKAYSVNVNVNDNVNDNVNVNDNDVLLPQNFAHTIRTIFYEENPDYPVSEKLDIRPAREIFEFLTSQGYKGLELFNYWRELARRRREVEFYKDKPLKIISSQIQGLMAAQNKPTKMDEFKNWAKV